MDNLYFVYQAIESKNEELFKQQIKVLKNMLSFSDSGKYEFNERALTSKPDIRKKVLEAMEVIWGQIFFDDSRWTVDGGPDIREHAFPT